MKIIKTALLDLGKGILASLASFIGLILGGMLPRLTGLPAPAADQLLPKGVDVSAVMPLMLLSGVIVSILLGECFRRLYPRYGQRFLGIALCHYLLYFLLNTLDALLFYVNTANLSTTILTNLFPAMFAALAIAGLWKPGPGEAAGARWLAGWKPSGWAWRLAAAWLAFPPIYYLAGRVVGIFTQHFYEDPSNALGLTLPPVSTLMAMQVLRGALFLLAALPVILAWRGPRKGLWLWLGALIYLQIGASVLFQAFWFPLALRVPHALELLVDSFAQAGLYAWLLYPRMRSRAAQAEPAVKPAL